MNFKNRVLTVCSIAFWSIIIYYAFTQVMTRARLGTLFIGGTFTIYILNEGFKAYEDTDNLSLALLSISGITTLIVTGYLFINFQALYTVRVAYALDHEYVLAVAFLLIVLYLTYREYDVTFLAVVLVGIGYGYFGNYVPGIFGHGGITGKRMLQILVLEMDGFFGFLTRLVAAWISLFILYAGLLRGYGAFDLMTRIAIRSSKYIRSGVAQSAVFSSMIIGSINGSTAANTAMTGSFTIPLMKKNGTPPEKAAGIEAVASTVGQVLPPVMGAGAFIMASLLNISYVTVLVAGLFPAAIMVLAIAIGVHYMSINEITEDQIEIEEFIDTSKTKQDLAIEMVSLFIPFSILIYTLGIAQWTVMTSGLYACLSMMVTGGLTPLAKSVASKEGDYKGSIVTGMINTLDGFRHGAISLAGIAIIMAAINGVVDILLVTGVPSALSLGLIAISGGIMVLAVILAMVISIILGLGMPTAAAYLIVALLIAPSLINQFAVPELAAHFFVFYCAILAAITPPIATSVAVGTGIAGSDFWKTAYQAMKLAIPLFVLPFSFVYHPELVDPNIGRDTIVTSLLVFTGAVGIIHGLNFMGESFTKRGGEFARIGYAIVGVVAMTTTIFWLQAGAALLILLLVLLDIRVFELQQLSVVKR
jgi:TRAP transporter 4TM/12TM fusion protein